MEIRRKEMPRQTWRIPASSTSIAASIPMSTGLLEPSRVRLMMRPSPSANAKSVLVAPPSIPEKEGGIFLKIHQIVQ